MHRSGWSRRALVAGGTALLADMGGARAQTKPQPSPPGKAAAAATPIETVLETAFDQARRVTVPVYLDGRGPYYFVVDTGSNRTVVSAEVASVLKLPSAGVAEVHGILSAEPATLATIRRIRVSEAISAGLQAPVVPESRLGADGILGIDMLKGRRVVLNFRDQRFLIAGSDGVVIGEGVNSRLSSPYAPIVVPARYRSGQLLIVDAHAAGVPITAFLDSGSQVTVANLALKAAAVKAQPDLADRLFHSELVSATGQEAPAEFGPLPGLRIGSHGVEAPLVAYADLHVFELWDLQTQPTLLIGVDVLRRFDQVAFDYGRKLITFWPSRTPPRPPPAPGPH